MNKAELIDAIATESGLSKTDAKKALEAFTASTSKALKGGERVTLVGFGTFSVNVRQARTGVNPQTKQEMQIPEKKVVKFKAGNLLQTDVQ
jgi:DNA-binding protein HU-beta